jgi:hypothetical protein
MQFIQPLQFDRQHAGVIVWGQHFGFVLVQYLVHLLDRAAMATGRRERRRIRADLGGYGLYQRQLVLHKGH